MGFRDPKCFNQALLARQAWRLLKKLNSICAQILKAKYYPRGNLLDIVFTKDNSQSWKGVEHGLELLKQGVIWRVGDGETINIWRDNWIKREGNLKITSEKKRCRLKKVKSLLGNNQNGWNEELVRSTFLTHDVEEILKIKVAKNKIEDTLAWHHEKNGQFTVSSAYKLAFKLKNGAPNASSTNPDGKRTMWQNIWKAAVPNKVRIFGWRLANDNLPT